MACILILAIPLHLTSEVILPQKTFQVRFRLICLSYRVLRVLRITFLFHLIAEMLGSENKLSKQSLLLKVRDLVTQTQDQGMYEQAG